MERIQVVVRAHDPISRAGVLSQLRQRPEVEIMETDRPENAHVGLVVADSVCEQTLGVLRTLRCHGDLRLVVVAGTVDDSGLLAIVEIGVSGVVRRAEASPERLVSVIRSATAGGGAMPPDLLGRLLAQVSRVQGDLLTPRGLSFSGLAEREIQVLRLIAEGYDTAEVAAELAYSQRTVKTVLHDITTRLHLRNRAHAVAYALRNGLL
ncbi:LuxR C-terminal-related transcriptional regulator [Nonomuraea sp. NPDC050790]|uniref:helix-turn-helix transcriptional regulator n=1 Tax=Nonomuraea sp. NPDC050790 TaxID=3364371 RepID=UPI0037B7FF88